MLKPLTKTRVMKRVTYIPGTGELHNKNGDVISRISKKGNSVVKIQKRTCAATDVIWVLHFANIPKGKRVVKINPKGTDQIENLKLVSDPSKGKMNNPSPTSESTELPIENVNTTSVISMKELPVLDKRNVKLSPTLFNIFTDGGARKKDGRSAKRGEKYTTDNAVCASGVVWVTEGKIVRAKGYKLKDHATNNCAELAAFYFALQPLLNNHKDSSITIHTDSVYCTMMLAKAVVNSECGKGKANRPLVNSCRQVLRQFTDVRIVKVKAHSGIQLNELADSLCTVAMGS